MAQARGTGLGRARGAGNDAAISPDGRIGRDEQRLGRQTLGQRRQLGIAEDPGVQRADLRVLYGSESAVGQFMKLGQFVLLKKGAGRDALRVGDRDGRAVGPGRRGPREAGSPGQKQRSHSVSSLLGVP
jgi:hypothetical protein